MGYAALLTADLCLSRHYAVLPVRQIALWQNIFTHSMAADYDCLFVGDSRVMQGYNPMIVDSLLGTHSYNLGLSGRSWPTHELLQKVYRREAYPSPRLMLVELDYLLFYHREQPDEIAQFYPFYYTDLDMHRFLLRKNTLSPRARLVPLCRYIGRDRSIMDETMQWWAKWQNEYDKQQGFTPVHLHIGTPYTDSSETKLLHHDRIEVEHFEIFLRRCRKEGTTVVLITSPTHESYWQCHVKDSAATYTIFDSLSHRHGLTWLDYTHSPLCHDTANFYNATHLNALGADRFSRLLAHDLDSLGLGRRRRVQ